MRDERDHNQASGGVPPCDSVGALLRAAADGELCEKDLQRLAEHLSCSPDDEHRLAFEKSLRGACHKAMATCPKGRHLCCSESLRERVERIARASREGGETGPPGEAEPGESPGESPGVLVEAKDASTRSPAFWRTTPGLFFAAAAAVLLGTLGVLFWQGQAGAPGAGELTYVSYRDEVANFVAGEHGHCQADKAHAKEKFVWKSAEAVRDHVSALVGMHVSLPALDQPAETLVIKDAGRCGVPGSDGRSAHIRMEIPAADDNPTTLVSLFVCPQSAGMLPMQPGVTYVLHPSTGVASTTQVLAWLDEGVVYYLVTTEHGDGHAAERAAECLGRDMSTKPKQL